MLIYPGPLPEGALIRVGPPATRPAARIAPLWLDASAGIILSEEGRVVGWTAREGGMKAVPVSANPKGTAHADQSLQFVAGENSGLQLADAVSDMSCVSFAAILSPNMPEARTLLSVQAHGSDDYVFLSLEGMRLRVAQREGPSELALTLPPDSRVPLLVICALAAGKVRLSVNDGPVVQGALAVPAGPADLFIGCRNGKGGMKNKLGSFDLSDVMVWPGQDLLQGTLTALWEDRCRLGL